MGIRVGLKKKNQIKQTNKKKKYQRMKMYPIFDAGNLSHQVCVESHVECICC